MPLTQEQFNALRRKGLSPQQIASFEAGNVPERTSPPASPIEKSAKRYGAIFPSQQGAATPVNQPGFLETAKQLPGAILESPGAILGESSRLIGNIPSSTVHFAKGLFDFFNPLNTGKKILQIPGEFQKLTKETGGISQAIGATAKELPGATLEVAKGFVPDFLKHLLAGRTEEAQRSLVNDPVGQIGPIILVGKQIAEGLGKGAEFDNAISKIASPITKPVGAAMSAVRSGIKNAATQALGAQTGAGAESIRAANRNSPEFREAMRGGTSEIEIVDRARELFQNLKEKRGAEYGTRLEQISGIKSELDIQPIFDTVQKQLDNFKVKVEPQSGDLDFSHSVLKNDPEGQTAVKRAFESVNTWDDYTPSGLDTLKRQIENTFTPSSPGRVFTSAIENSVRQVLRKNVTGYEAMTKQYREASDILKDITAGTGVGGRATTDTIISKITTAMRSDKEFRIQMLEELGGNELVDSIAGFQMKTVIPKGLVGRGIDVGILFNFLHGLPSWPFLVELSLTSPRVVGEFISALGLGVAKTKLLMGFLHTVKTKVAPSFGPSGVIGIGGTSGSSAQDKTE